MQPLSVEYNGCCKIYKKHGSMCMNGYVCLRVLCVYIYISKPFLASLNV